MNHLSIRGLPTEVAAILKQHAKTSGKSLNQYVIDILAAETGVVKKQHYTRSHHDLDHLFGIWSEDEFLAIQGKIDQESQIDAELWS